MKLGLIAGMVCITLFDGNTNALAGEPPPLSCEMKMLLTGVTALLRDQGVTRKDSTMQKNPHDLTPKEVKMILDRVYIEGRNQTPDQIKDDVFKKCKNGK